MWTLIFDFLTEHWILSTLYVIFSLSPALRFRREVVMKSRFRRWIQHHLFRKWNVPILRFFGGIFTATLLWPVATILCVLAGPVLWIILARMDAKNRKIRAEEEETARVQHLEVRRRIEEENARRAKARKEWLVANPPQLFYNTMFGVTAIVRPADYAVAQKETARLRRDGLWDNDVVLRPISHTFIFVTKQGEDLIRANVGREGALIGHRLAGRMTALDDIVEESSVTLVRKDDLFVPWVNEGVLSFPEQERVLGVLYNDPRLRATPLSWHLIDAQAPTDL